MDHEQQNLNPKQKSNSLLMIIQTVSNKLDTKLSNADVCSLSQATAMNATYAIGGTSPDPDYGSTPGIGFFS